MYWVSRYVGKQFDGPYGCMDMTITVLRAEFGHGVVPECPQGDVKSQRQRAAELSEALFKHCISVIPAARKPGDLVVISLKGFPAHVGIYAGENSLLHTNADGLVCLERLDSVTLKNRLVGYFRYMEAFVKA